MAAEARIEKKSCAHATTKGWLARKLKTHNNRGAPDRMFLRNGRVLFVEFKAPNGRLSKLQIYEHEQYFKKGIKVHVVDNFKDFAELIT